MSKEGSERTYTPGELQALWYQLGAQQFDVNKDVDGCMELKADYYIWKKGTPMGEIHKWFEQQYPGGIKKLSPGL